MAKLVKRDGAVFLESEQVVDEDIGDGQRNHGPYEPRQQAGELDRAITALEQVHADRDGATFEGKTTMGAGPVAVKAKFTPGKGGLFDAYRDLISLRATSRFSSESFARNTSPNPPDACVRRI